MNYPFHCIKCGLKTNISIPITEYHSDKHYCHVCNTELVREVSSLVCGVAIDHTNSFFKRSTI